MLRVVLALALGALAVAAQSSEWGLTAGAMSGQPP